MQIKESKLRCSNLNEGCRASQKIKVLLDTLNNLRRTDHDGKKYSKRCKKHKPGVRNNYETSNNSACNNRRTQSKSCQRVDFVKRQCPWVTKVNWELDNSNLKQIIQILHNNCIIILENPTRPWLKTILSDEISLQ